MSARGCACADAGSLPAGTAVGPYRVVERLGGGSSRAVYKVQGGGEARVLEVLGVEHASADERERFERRARRDLQALARLDNPHVVRIHDVGWWHAGGFAFPYLVKELVEGPSLREWIFDERPSLRRLLDAFVQIAIALSQLHREGLCHRDLDVDNIRVRRGGQPVVLQVGVAEGRAAVALTVADVVRGAVRYVSPEFAEFFLHGWRRGDRYAHLATADFHALGALLYEALAGTPPFPLASDSVEDLLRGVMARAPLNPCDVAPDVPPALGALVERMLARRFWERPQDGEELARALRHVLDEADARWGEPLPRSGCPKASG